MRETLLRPISGEDESTQTWLNRVRENLGQLLAPSRLKPSSANGAPIHLLKFDKSPRPARAQGASLITHATVFGLVLFLLTHAPNKFVDKDIKDSTPLSPLTFPATLFSTLTSAHPSGGRGSGGDQNPIPATHGNLPPLSSVVLVKPTLPQEAHSHLPEPPTIFDPNAAPVLAPTIRVGLPWMPADTNSPGPGKGRSIGSKDGNTLGDGGLGPAGDGTGNGPYIPGLIPPACAYCPTPTYTDEARHSKVQGTVTLQVLVGTDGRAEEIRVVRGVGFGLDERAVESVRGWRFTPARDGERRAVTAWVTVEAVFRLF
ncbi:MAG: TonB family protein [Candidatus Acidiferrum sp.]